MRICLVNKARELLICFYSSIAIYYVQDILSAAKVIFSRHVWLYFLNYPFDNFDFLLAHYVRHP